MSNVRDTLTPAMLRMLEGVNEGGGSAHVAGDGTLTIEAAGRKIGGVATGMALVRRGLLSRDGRWRFSLTREGADACETTTDGGTAPKCHLGYSLLQCEDARESGRLQLPKCEFCFLGCPVAAVSAIHKAGRVRQSE